MHSVSSLSGWKEIWLFFCVIILQLSVMQGYDPCPESYRESAAGGGSSAALSRISADDIEKAFQQAESSEDNERQKERRRVSEGRVIDPTVHSPETVHPQSFVQPEVREMELSQRVFQKASAILTEEYNLSSDEVCCSLPKVNLNSSRAAFRAVQRCLADEPKIRCDPYSKYRTADGTCNNLENPTWGSALSCFNRLMPPVYSDNEAFRKSVTGGPLPRARVLSVNVHRHKNLPTHDVNHMYMFYGQELDHDISFTSPSTTENNGIIECCPVKPDNHPACAPIIIPHNDPFYEFYSRYNKTCLNFVRSAICRYCKPGPRVQISQLTAFIDGSAVYENNVTKMNNLRDKDLPGNLRVQKTKVGDLMPRSDNPQTDRCSKPYKNKFCFEVGDFRGNQHLMLTSLHTLLVRLHNNIADQLREMNCNHWNEETIFQETRKIVGAIIQMITYDEWMPITFGDEQMTKYGLWISSCDEPTKYNDQLNPGLTTEFSTAAFRFGHTFINMLVAQIPDPNGHYKSLLRNLFSNPFGLYRGEMDSLMRGATNSSAQLFDRHLVPDVSRYLFRNPNTHGPALDLPAFNIQRGRDNGLQPYVEMVRFCTEGKTVIKCFDDLHQVMSLENAKILEKNYRDVRDVDLWVGIILENEVPGALIGPTAACIMGRQFNRLKYGDRFYFEHEGVFTARQRQELKKVSFSGIICNNTEVERMQEIAMLFPSDDNPVRPCCDFPQLDLDAWRVT